VSNRKCKYFLQYRNILVGQKAQFPVTTMLESADTLVKQKERSRNRHANRRSEKSANCFLTSFNNS